MERGLKDPEIMAVFLIETPLTVIFAVSLFYLSLEVFPMSDFAVYMSLLTFITIVTFFLRKYFLEALEDDELVTEFNNCSRKQKESLEDKAILMGLSGGAILVLSVFIWI